ncbi:MAG: GntR family transcriptional regulator [Nocardioides sp.]|uniref:GntR family transcriptional regulator n=1 Tax=Nocardioides sp. TaxID=35761 RepID=UPI0039E2972C
MSDLSPRRQPPVRRSDDIYAKIRREIVRGGLRPNQRIAEIELAEWLKVSRTPVREALLRLELDGLVATDRRGWMVYEHTAKEIEEIFQCRIALDSYATRCAALQRTDAQLADIQAVRSAAVDIDPTHAEELVQSNDLFHDLVIDAAANPLMTRLIEQSRVYHFNRRVAIGYTPTEWERSHAEHAAIADAIARQDADEAEGLARAHISWALERTLATLDAAERL